MPTSNFEERVQKRLASSLKLRHFSMALTAAVPVFLVALALADDDSKPYILIIFLLVIFAGAIPSLIALKRRRSVVIWVRRSIVENTIADGAAVSRRRGESLGEDDYSG
jgi:hypothetical protein